MPWTGAVASGLALTAFVAIFALSVPFPLIILAAALIGALALPGQATDAPPLAVSPRRTLATIAFWLALWLVPLLLLHLFAPAILAEIALYFSTLAIVTFGGAYAVLAYMVQEVVQGFGWLTTAQMMDALGLAETTPGPLILVTQFVGFLAGHGDGGGGMGLLAALVTLWATFTPCFLWIFAGAPYVEWIATRPRLTGALGGITAAVVGVIANLSLWFALTLWFADGAVTPGALDLPALALTALAALLLIWRRWDLLLALPAMAAAGIALCVI